MTEDPYDDMYLEVELIPGFPILGVYDVFMNRIEFPDKNLLVLTDQELERLNEKLYWKTFSDTIRELERRDMLNKNR